MNLSHQVLKIRYRLLHKTPPELPKAVTNFGEKARILQASVNEMTTHLNTLYPGGAILVRTDENREYLRSTLKSSLVFTIEEAKALEFDTVFLLDFFQYWQKRGEYYFKAEFYLQAIECFEKSGDKFKEKKSRAKLLQREGNYQEAAAIFVDLEKWQPAAELFQRVKNWQLAANC